MLRVMLEGGFEADYLLVPHARAAELRVDGAVEHHPARLLREEVGVHAAQGGSVGEADVIEFLVSHKAAQNVEVPRGRLRAEVRKQIARLLLASLRLLLGEGFVCLLPFRG